MNLSPTAVVTPPDRELVAKAQAGDDRAFRLLVDRYKEKCVRLAYGWTRHFEEARDIAQESFVSAYKALPRFRGDSEFSTWLYRIVVNRCKDAYKRKKDVLVGDDNIFELQRDPSKSVQDLIQTEDEQKMLTRALSKLSDIQRQVVILRYFEELSVSETAQITGQAEGTVKATCFQAVEKLRQIIGTMKGA